MNSLGVHGDPGGWQQAGETIRAVAGQLAEELAAADAAGGSGLNATWSGPAAGAYLDLWNHRHGRYGDLLYHAGRAATAFADFGERLADLQGRAADLERCWLGAGLHLSLDGLRFVLPSGHENLPQEIQATLHGCLDESERDIAAIWADVTAAVGDMVLVLESVLAAIADFEALAVSAGFSVTRYVISDLFDPRELPGHLHDLAELASEPLGNAAGKAERFAELVKADIGLAAPADQPAVADMADTAARRAKLLRYADKGDKAMRGAPGLVLANVATVGITAHDVNRDGWYGAMVKDKDAGLVAGTAAEDAANAALTCFAGPEVADSPVGIAVEGVAGLGVGWAVQSGVDVLARHPKIVEAGAHAVADAVRDDAQGVTELAGAARHAVGWEASHLADLL